MKMHEAYAEFEKAAAIERAKLAEAKKIRDAAIKAAHTEYDAIKQKVDEACKAEYAKFRAIQDEFRAGRAAARDAREKAAAKTAEQTTTPTEPVAEEVVKVETETKTSKKRSAKKVEA